MCLFAHPSLPARIARTYWSSSMTTENPLVAILMGSRSDWDATMSHAAARLDALGVPYEIRVISAHRAPEQLVNYVSTFEERGIELVIAGAGGAAHLPGVTAGLTYVPVLGVPTQAWSLDGLDSLLSIVQMPKGVPVATFSVGKPGAINAALFATSMLGLKYPELRAAYRNFRVEQAETVVDSHFP